MAGLIKRLEKVMASQAPTYYDGELYRPECHYMKGPGPASRAKRSSLPHTNGSDSRLVGAPTAARPESRPDALSALLSRG